MQLLKANQSGHDGAAGTKASTSEEALPAPLAGVVAIVGCDGTGKSTLVNDLVHRFGASRPTVRRYMGLVSGETGDKIKAMPVIGAWLEAYLARKVRRAQDMKEKVPGIFTAIVMYFFSLWRVFQLWRLQRLSRRGVLIIADRYPQREVPGFHYDGPGLSAERSTNWLVRKLAIREQKLYDQMARLRPSLVIRLNIDAETAWSRKPDHPIEELRDKIEIMPHIRFNGATLCEIDARKPYPVVLSTAMEAISALG